ncbi:MAG: hypothetical protein D4R97_08945 [Bacteroidetes bacterium]|nr:MAG: hypothetical protein D4R97_08945 [Bacteroidota bacterium]
MKKQNKIIIGVIVGIAVVILLVSFFFPSAYRGLISGSFGKADKYHQEQMTEKDVQLRSDITKDTAQLRQMITGLIYFALFTDNFSMTIDTCLVSYQLQGFDKDPANTQVIAQLKDYSTFLKNNSKTLATTTRMLAAFLLQDTLSGSMDIEQNIRDFGNYVNQVNQKDSVLTVSLARLDSYLVGNKTLQKKDEEIRNLKAIRDQLVIKSTQFMALTGNKPGLGSMLNYAMQSQAQFSGIGALNRVVDGSSAALSKIGVQEIPSMQKLSALDLNVSFSAASALQSNLSSSQVNAAGSIGGNANLAAAAKGNLNNILVYDKPNLNFVVGSVAQLNVVYGTEKMNAALSGINPNLGALGVIAAKNLSVTLNAGLLCNIASSPTLSAALSAAQLNEIIPAKELSAVALGSGNFGSKAGLQMGLCGNSQLQGILSSNPGLQRVLSNNGALSGVSSLQSISLGLSPQ